MVSSLRAQQSRKPWLGQEGKRVLMGSVNSCQCTGKKLDGQAVTTANWKVLSDTVREKGDFG